jgi:hypothetical protein
MLKAMRALTRYATVGIQGTGLGDSNFRVLEVLLHKGPLPVNTIGPVVDLTAGSISIAVDRLVEKGLVSPQLRGIVYCTVSPVQRSRCAQNGHCGQACPSG